MKQYESYKDSGIDWLGKIPSHWISSKLKHHTSIVLGKMLMSNPPIGQEHLYTYEKYLKSRNIGWLELFLQEGEVEHMWFNDSEKNMYELKANDIVMNEGGDIGKVALWKEQPFKCYIQNSVNKITSKEDIHPSFLQFLLYSIAQTNYFWSVANPVSIAHLTKEKLSETPIIIPPKTEQIIIASYLDYKVGQIDATIAEKEQMLEDLKAYRSAMISEAVTKGLEKNVEMKDSGIKWLGMIPAIWECSSLKHFLSQPLQYGANESAESTNPDWPRYIRITDIDEYGNLRDETFKSLDPDKAKDYLLVKGDVLFARSGATVGKTYIFNEDYAACFAGYLIKAKCGKKLLPQFLYLYTNSIQYENWKNSVFIQATIQNIGADKYSLLPIVVPSIEEQKDIIEYVNTKLGKLDSVLADIQSQIDDLKAYKSSIITEAVTGKVDLRGWKPNNNKT